MRLVAATARIRMATADVQIPSSSFKTISVVELQDDGVVAPLPCG